jgi:hypothetical protein
MVRIERGAVRGRHPHQQSGEEAAVVELPFQDPDHGDEIGEADEREECAGRQCADETEELSGPSSPRSGRPR